MTAIADLSAERLREILDYNPDTGIFTWIKPTSNRVKIGAVAGYFCPIHNCIRIRLFGNLHFAHRLAWLYVTGKHPIEQIDHINGNRLDNRIENLREATDQQNKQNLGVSKANKSGMRGVHFVKKKNKWCAQITSHRKTRSLGYFDSKEAAYGVYLEARKEIHTFSPGVRA